MAARPMPEAIDAEVQASEGAGPVRMSLEEYLHTAFHPDREYVDGWAVPKTEEKTVGTREHGYLQAELAYWFRLHRSEWKVRVGNEIRTLVTATRVRLPDVVVIAENSDVKERVRSTPPLLAIEILAPEDRFNRVIPRLEDFARMGTENIWLLDPDERVAYRYADGALRLVQETRLTVPNSAIYLDLPELFASALD